METETELCVRGAQRIYKTLADKLLITRTYKFRGSIVCFSNRLNPLLYIYLFICIVVSPLCCLFTTFTIQDFAREIHKTLFIGRLY